MFLSTRRVYPQGRHNEAAPSCMMCFSSRKTIQAISKGCDLSTMLAFVSIVHIDKDIIQGILHSIPGKCSGLAQGFGGNGGDQRHHLDMRVIELRENLLYRFRFAPVDLNVIESI